MPNPGTRAAAAQGRRQGDRQEGSGKETSCPMQAQFPPGLQQWKPVNMQTCYKCWRKHQRSSQQTSQPEVEFYINHIAAGLPIQHLSLDMQDVSRVVSIDNHCMSMFCAPAARGIVAVATDVVCRITFSATVNPEVMPYFSSSLNTPKPRIADCKNNNTACQNGDKRA